MLKNGLKLAIHGVSDVGLSREHNEDCIRWDIDLGLVMLADGMGGHNAGEVASELAVTAIHDEVFRLFVLVELDGNRLRFRKAF